MRLMTMFFLGIFAVCISCNNEAKHSASQRAIADELQSDSIVVDSMAAPMLQETFIDSIHIGRKGLNKIEVFKYSADSIYVVIKFYAKQADKWVIKNEFQFEKDGLSECDTRISDFNNDGLNDMTYVSAVAPRGANEIRSLFIYDAKLDQLVFIKESDHYPNLQYNELLDCVDAWVFHSGTSTYFLKIEKDSLRRFAEVIAMDDSLFVYTINKHGEQKIIKAKKIENTDEFIRYKNFDPLIENLKPENYTQY